MHVTGVKDLLARRLTLVAVSQRSAAECAAMYGCQAAAFRVAYNGADIPSTDHAELRTQPHHPFRVGFLGTLAAFKGWRKVITAVEQLRGEGLPVVCSIVGAGRDLPALQRLAVERAEWLDAPGHVENPGEHLFPALDVLVLPSECEGHPQVILEALGSGVPCICSDVGGCAETIRHGREGYILRENSAEEIAAYINNIVSSEPLWAQLSHNSLARHREAFTAQHMVNRWEQLYRDGSHP
jgi:glycosyltransferase involved in cell wall biosynthesis